jgi:hypothetical protein
VVSVRCDFHYISKYAGASRHKEQAYEEYVDVDLSDGLIECAQYDKQGIEAAMDYHAELSSKDISPVSEEQGSYRLTDEQKGTHHTNLVLFIADQVQVNHPVVQSNGSILHYLEVISVLVKTGFFDRAGVVGSIYLIVTLELRVELQEGVHGKESIT